MVDPQSHDNGHSPLKLFVSPLEISARYSLAVPGTLSLLVSYVSAVASVMTDMNLGHLCLPQRTTAQCSVNLSSGIRLLFSLTATVFWLRIVGFTTFFAVTTCSALDVVRLHSCGAPLSLVFRPVVTTSPQVGYTSSSSGWQPC